MITLATINANDPISDGPNTLNSNFSAIKQHIDDLENLLNPTNNTLKLTNLATIPNDSIESASITLTQTSGNVLVVAPNGGTATLTITFDGKISGTNVTLTGTGADKSVIEDLDINGDLNINGDAVVDALINFSGANARVAWKTRMITLVDANMGSGATVLIDVSKDAITHLDYYNGGVALAGNSELKLDTTNFIEGQIFEFHCARINSGGMRFYNGTLSNEIFAYLEPNGAGYTSVAAGTKPEFTPSTTPNNQSYGRFQWTNIGGGNMRLVLLNQLNMTGTN